MGDPQFICRALTQGTTASFKGHSRTWAQATCSADASAIRVGVGTLEAAGPTSAVAAYRYRPVLGVVSVPPAYISQVVRLRDGPWPYWEKAGLVVRAGRGPVT